MSKDIQLLVDQHALFGMSNAQVKKHLHEMHSIPVNTLIPPISAMAIKARNKFLRTGKLPEWSDATESSSPSKTSGARSSNAKRVFSSDPEIAKLQLKADIEAFSDEIEEEFGFKPIIEANVITPSELEGWDAEDTLSDRVEIPTEACYVKNRPTSLDRWMLIHLGGFMFSVPREDVGNIVENTTNHFNLGDHVSVYTIFSHYVKDLAKNQHKDINDITDLAMVYGNNMPRDLVLISNFLLNNDTMNIQLPIADCEEFLTSVQITKDNHWLSIASQQPVYIDFSNKKHGDRYISGIVSIPMPDGSISFGAFVEKKDIGAHLFILWDNDKIDDNGHVTAFEDDFEVTKTFNDEVQCLIALALKLYKSVLNAEFLGLLTNKGKIHQLSDHMLDQDTLSGEANTNSSMFSFVKKELNYLYKENKKNRTDICHLDAIFNDPEHLFDDGSYFICEEIDKDNDVAKATWNEPTTSSDSSTKLDLFLKRKLH